MRTIIRFLALLPLSAVICSCGNPTGDDSFRHPLAASADTNVVLPPAWAFGVLYGGYTDQEGTIGTIREILEHDYPIDAYWMDSWFWSFADQGIGPHKYIDFVADTVAYPDRRALWDFMEQHRIKGGFWVWDCIQETGNEEAFHDFKSRGFFRDVYNNTNPWHNKSTSTAMHREGSGGEGTPTGNIDFGNPEAAAWFKTRMKHFFDEGADFIKLDRTTHLSVVRTMFEISQEYGRETEGRGFVLSHMDGLGDPAYKRYPVKWTSDTRSDWTIDKPLKEFNSWVPRVAFRENIALYTNPASPTSEIPFLTNDTGGFDMGNTSSLDEELFIRWMQFSLFTQVTSLFSQPENPTGNLPWRYSPRADSIFRFYSHLRLELFPYLYSLAHRHRLEGKSMIGKIPGDLTTFLLGDELLVAPVTQQGALSRTVRFPEGEWISLADGTTYPADSVAPVPAPLEQIPLFVRKGSLLPMRPYASSVEKGDNNLLRLQVYPGGNARFTLVEDDGTSNDYLEGRYAVTTIGLWEGEKGFEVEIAPVKGSYRGMQPGRRWEFIVHTPVEPAVVTLNGRKTRYAWSEREGRLTVVTPQLPKGRKISLEIRFPA